MTKLARIEALLGAALADVDEEALQRFGSERIREYQDLEFKRELYGNSEGKRKELAGDVAAFANAVGGLIVIGQDEDNDGAAANRTPVELSEAEELRMQSIVVDLIVPRPTIHLHRVTTAADNSKGYYLLEVPRSPHAPHAVRRGESLGYPKRQGAMKVWLSESEVANAYRNRFAAARAETDRLSRIRAEGEAAFPPSDGSPSLSIALVPTVPGELSLTNRIVQELHGMAAQTPATGIPWSVLTRDTGWRTMAGFQRIVLHVGEDRDRRPKHGLLHLHTDGSGFVAAHVGHERRDEGNHPTGTSDVIDAELTWTVMASLKMLIDHAVNRCGTRGDAIVEATLLSSMPMRLGMGYAAFRSDTQGHHLAADGAPITQRSINLDECAASTSDLAIVTRTMANDLAQGFGIAELQFLDSEGAVRVEYFVGEERQIEQVAANLGLAVSQKTA